MGESLNNTDPAPTKVVANPGWIRPPRIYLTAIALGVLGHALLPVHILPRIAGVPIGALLVLAAVALYVSAVRSFTAAGTPVPGNQPATAIVRAGPYRFTRNPIYLAFTLLHLGIALLANSLTLLITLIPAVGLMSLVVIPREEHYLGMRFPAEYGSYKASVRRWL
jgi:protein-S-isoprenylcysteine O-methyltransferase Ste14